MRAKIGVAWKQRGREGHDKPYISVARKVQRQFEGGGGRWTGVIPEHNGAACRPSHALAARTSACAAPTEKQHIAMFALRQCLLDKPTALRPMAHANIALLTRAFQRRD